MSTLRIGALLHRSFRTSLSGKAFLSSSVNKPSLDISGIYPPIVTPFENNGAISFQKLKSNVEAWNKIPFKGYVCMGSNGESVSLSSQEKIELVRQVKSLSKPGQLIIAGTGCHSTAETIDLTRQVSKDCDAALVITPSFYGGRMTDTALYEHYKAVADASPLPVILYSVPANTHLDLSVDVTLRLAEHKNIIGLKDSGGDIGKISRIVYATKDQDFQVLAGSAGFLLPALLMGCVGGIAALANVLGNEVCQLYNLYENKDLEAAIALQRRLILPNLLVTRKFGVAGLKATMDLNGLYGGPCRPPLLPVDKIELDQLTKAFVQENFLKLN